MLKIIKQLVTCEQVTGEQACSCTCSLLMMEGGMEKKNPAFTPSIATDGLPSNA